MLCLLREIISYQIINNRIRNNTIRVLKSVKYAFPHCTMNSETFVRTYIKKWLSFQTHLRSKTKRFSL